MGLHAYIARIPRGPEANTRLWLLLRRVPQHQTYSLLFLPLTRQLPRV